MIRMTRWRMTALNGAILVAFFAAVGCGDDDGGGDVDAGPGDDAGDVDTGPDVDAGEELPTGAPTTVEMVAAGSASGFHSPTDAVASLDGAMFYFAAYQSADSLPAIF